MLVLLLDSLSWNSWESFLTNCLEKYLLIKLILNQLIFSYQLLQFSNNKSNNNYFIMNTESGY